MIREAMFFGGVLYILITIAQIIDRPSIWAEGIVVISCACDCLGLLPDP